jgi:type IV pilus assembly protein PilV
MRTQPGLSDRGTTMIEVLVTVVILTIGLLGLAGLQFRLQRSEMEAYQRAQALILLEDMANRIAVNRNVAADYITGTASALGAGMACPADITTRQKRDASEWCNALQGASEKSGAGNVGTMIGGRGCVETIGSNQYLVTVAWQGLGPVSAPPVSVACGANLYDGADCTNDRCRRAMTTIVSIAPLL